VFFNQLWLEATTPIARRIQLKLASLGLEGLAGMTVAAVARVGLLIIVDPTVKTTNALN
jgi:hypothetical protein